MNYLSQDKYIEISYLSSGKWDKLDKSGMIFPQLCQKGQTGMMYWYCFYIMYDDLFIF